MLYYIQIFYFRNGGIIPPIAQDLHRQHIERVVSETFTAANLSIQDVDAIAVTNRPGLSLSLLVGLRYAKHLARTYSKPLIPIHHMEAHAITARINQRIQYPYLCLLASGGHCLLTFVHDVNRFELLGESLDDAPGEAFDKVSRRLKLRNLPKYEWVSGGQAIEIAALEARNPELFDFPLPLARHRNCQFSFAGLKNTAKRHIERVELEHQLPADQVMPNYPDFCAAFLHAVTRHLCHRTQRAIEYCDRENYFPAGSQKTLVFSGGVACNTFIYQALKEMADQFQYETHRPERQYCTDNGLMIAWTGIEQWRANADVYRSQNIDDVETFPKCALGENRVKEVEEASIPCKWAKLSVYKEYNDAKTAINK